MTGERTNSRAPFLLLIPIHYLRLLTKRIIWIFYCKICFIDQEYENKYFSENRNYFGIILLFYISIDTLLTKPVNNETTTLIKGHFNNIERFKLKNKVSVSYNLFIQEKEGFYKILPEWIDCFDYQSFRNEVKKGQSIEIFIRNDNGLRPLTLPVVVSIKANDKDYLDQNCINQEIKKEKVKIPLFCIGFIIIGGLFIYIKTKR